MYYFQSAPQLPRESFDFFNECMESGGARAATVDDIVADQVVTQ